MREHVGMERKIAGPQFIKNRRAELLDVFDLLIEHGGSTRFAPFEVPDFVGAGQKHHRGVFLVGVVNGEPDRDGASGRERPIRSVLMPVNGFGIVRQFAEKMAAPAHEIFAQQVGDMIQNARIRRQIPNAGAVRMITVDRILITPVIGGPDLPQKPVEIFPIGARLGFIENAERLEKTVAVVTFDLPCRKNFRRVVFNGRKAQIAFVGIHCSLVFIIG